MKIAHTHKAQGIIDNEPVEDVTILINQEIPEFESLEDAAQYYKEQGKLLADALFETLPGGTIDQLLIEILCRRASLFKIRFTD